MAQMVARYLGVVEAAGSNPVTQTRLDPERKMLRALYFILRACPAPVFGTAKAAGASDFTAVRFFLGFIGVRGLFGAVLSP